MFKELRRKYGNFIVLLAGGAIVNLPFYAVWSYLPLFLKDLKAGNLEVGMIYTIYPLILTFSGLVGAHFSDLYGRKRTLVIGGLLVGSSSVLLALSVNWVVACGALFFRAISLFYSPAEITAIAESINETKKATGYGVYSTVIKVAALPGPLLGGIVYQGLGTIGIRILFLTLGLVDCFKAVFYYLFLTETLENRKMCLNIMEAIQEAYKGLKTSVSLLFSRKLRSLILFIFLYYVAASLISPFWVLFAKEVVGLSILDWGLISSSQLLLSLLLATPLAMFSDRWGRSNAIRFSAMMAALSAFMYSSFSRNLPTAVIFVALNAVALLLLLPSAKALITDVTASNERAKGMSVLSLAQTLPAVASSIGAILYDVSKILPFYVATCVYLLALLFSFILSF
ncbi:MAG: MFS transporter [Thermoproteota archaeon]